MQSSGQGDSAGWRQLVLPGRAGGRLECLVLARYSEAIGLELEERPKPAHKRSSHDGPKTVGQNV